MLKAVGNINDLEKRYESAEANEEKSLSEFLSAHRMIELIKQQCDMCHDVLAKHNRYPERRKSGVRRRV